VNAQPSDGRPQNGEVIPLEQVVDRGARWSRRPIELASAAGTMDHFADRAHSYRDLSLSTPAGGAGLDCDKLSKEAADFHYDHCVKPLLRKFDPELTRRCWLTITWTAMSPVPKLDGKLPA